ERNMSAITETIAAPAEAVPMSQSSVRNTDLRSRGEPALWALGGTLALGVAMIAGFLILVFWNGAATFVPKPIAVVTEAGGAVTAGEPFRTEVFRPQPDEVAKLSA